ncbi:hypothetical protein [Paenibacillus sp. Soil787]|nr:hypothetical protein [Paenibacillus sp. Soil787]
MPSQEPSCRSLPLGDGGNDEGAIESGIRVAYNVNELPIYGYGFYNLAKM